MNSQVLIDRELLQDLIDGAGMYEFCTDTVVDAATRLLATPAPIPDAAEGVAGYELCVDGYSPELIRDEALANRELNYYKGRGMKVTLSPVYRQSVSALRDGGGVTELAVWYGAMPESNGKSNFTALLHRKGESLMDGVVVTLARSEYPERVRYEADRVRYLIGEIDAEPFILDYDANKHSGYTAPLSKLETTTKAAGVGE